MVKPNIFITGATGFIGSAFLEKLISFHRNEYNKIYCLSRKIIKNNKDVIFIRGDICNKNSYSDILKKCDVVYHLAGLVKHGISFRKELFRNNVLGTKNILDLCLENNLKVIYLSTAGIFHSKIDRVCDKSSKTLEEKIVNYYCYTKYLAYLEVLNFIEEGGKIISIMPVSVYSKKSPLFLELVGFLYKYKIFPTVLLNRSLSLVSIDNVIRVLLSIKIKNIGNRRNESYIIADDEIEILEIINELENYLNIKVIKISMPIFLWRFVLRVLYVYSLLFRRDLFFNLDNFNFLYGYLRVDLSKFNSDFDLVRGDFKDVFKNILLNLNNKKL
ncbi:NAD-dependent epimerase/dehydratase family protein [bacterium]|nr:NAD-dependent epimerase/dehydratase family protein [bacterium]